MVANANSLSFTSESNTLTPHKSFPGTDSPSTRRWWKPLRGRFVYFGALRETNCGSKVKLLESLGSQKIRKFLERWKNRLEKLDIESSLLPVVHGRREKDLIMWNVACYVHSFENKVIVLPFTDIIFLSPGPPTLPYFDTFIFSGCFGFGGGPRQLRTKFTLILGASTPHRRMSYQRRWRCYATFMLLSKSHLDSTGKIRGTCDWSDLQVYHLGAFVMHRCTWSQTCFKPAGKEFFKIFQRKKRRFDWCACVCGHRIVPKIYQRL